MLYGGGAAGYIDYPASSGLPAVSHQGVYFGGAPAISIIINLR